MSSRTAYFSADRPYSPLLNIAVDTLNAVRLKVRESIEDGSGLEPSMFTAADGTTKVMLQVDKIAENLCRHRLSKQLKKDCVVLGEETLWKLPSSLDLTKQHVTFEGRTHDPKATSGAEDRTVIIIDMIDGSDLVERGFGNWCSAMIAFRPGPPPKILFAMIHNDDDKIYGADEVGTFIIPRHARFSTEIKKLSGPELRRLRTAKERVKKGHKHTKDDKEPPEETKQIAICFYAQKFGHFSTIPGGFQRWMRTSPASERLRIYNIAGNPMMARLANGENIHAVFEHLGQYPHDAAPGAYIGLQAAAYLVDLNGKSIAINDLATKLLRPSERHGLKYVLASTKELAVTIARAIRTSV
jgi:fructose-1,6-bisphosphatase/inositol monophosphatase family enzyme